MPCCLVLLGTRDIMGRDNSNLQIDPSLTLSRAVKDNHSYKINDSAGGSISSKFSGHSVYFGPGERGSAIKELETFDKNMKRENLIAMLEMSTSSTAVLESIYRNNPPLNASGQPELTPEYLDLIANKVADSLKSEMSTMTEDQLKSYAGRYPGNSALSSVLDDFKARKQAVALRLDVDLPEGLNGRELNELDDVNSVTYKDLYMREIKPIQQGSVFEVFNLARDLKETGEAMRTIAESLGITKDHVSEFKKHNTSLFNVVT